MSLIATAASASAASPVANLFVHGHRKGGHAAISESSRSLSQSPTSTQGLFSSLLQSLEQVIGITATTSTSAAAGTTAAAGASAAAGTTGAAATSGIASIATTSANAATAANPAQEIQSFLHSLFQALKADGLGSSARTTGATAAQSATSTATAATGSSASSAATGAVQYQGGLVSSLQTLIQQLGSSGTSTPATANLSAAFNSLMQGANGNPATTGSSTASTQTSNAALQNFLSNLLQSAQSGGAHSLNSVGANVNTNV